MHGLSQIQRQNAEAARKEQEKREGEARLKWLIATHDYSAERDSIYDDPAGR